ncbi:MAG: GerMN domain-containing protein [Caldisericum sp.]|uniref:GerMN domain-containing protein n=1 Tax=Caldisericum sp. TaxID=2499687 RepID=UPI003D13C8F7
MRKRDTIKLISLFILIFFVSSLAGVLIYLRTRESETYTVKLYFYDPIPKELVPVEENFRGSIESITRQVFETLKAPKVSAYFPTIPKELTLDFAKYQDQTLTINILTNGAKKTAKEEYIAFLSLANSLKSIKGVNNLKILINSRENDVFLRYVNINETLSNLTSTLPKFKTVYLYFLTPDLNYLAVEKREILDTDKPEVLAMEILNELSYGSNIGLVSLLKPEYVRSIELKSGGLATVNLSNSINQLSLGSYTANLFVLSIVNSLTEIADIQKVSFNIDGNKIDTLFGTVDVSLPLARFNAMPNISFIIPYYVLPLNGNVAYVPVVIPTKTTDLTKIFEELKKPRDNLKTYLNDVDIKKIEVKGYTLKIVLASKKVLSAEEIDYIKKQVFLTTMELPNINTLDLTIGEEGFLLTR